MKLYLISILIGIGGALWQHSAGEVTVSCGPYYWFQVGSSYIYNCSYAQYDLIRPLDENFDEFPDEVYYGDRTFATYQFGCDEGGIYCCALAYELRDLEVAWDGRWQPKAWAVPKCITRRR